MTAPDDALELWALDALDAVERALLDAAVAGEADADAPLARSVVRLQRTVAALGERDATAPPAPVRSQLLAVARSRPRPLLDRSRPADAYAHQAAIMGDVLASVVGEQWGRAASPYGWTLHGLAAHLLQVERYMERVLGLASGAPDPHELDHLGLGAEQIEHELSRHPGETVADWRAAVERILPQLDSLDMADEVAFHQWPFSIGSLLVARSFEMWTHADDVRRAVDRPVAAPSVADVRVMTDTSVRSLPLAIHVVTGDVPDGRARVVLTGDGGATWDLVLGRGGPELATIVADAVDYCRLAARRIAPSSFRVTIDGDEILAANLLAAASVVAV